MTEINDKMTEINDAMMAQNDAAFSDRRAPAWSELKSRVLACTRCDLCHTRTNVVFGQGAIETPLVFVGEGPGADEDAEGLAFVGRAGQLLTQILSAGGITREEAFITNVVKCRPPGNRDPLPDEMMACSGYLDAQIAAIKPKVVVTLGRFSMARWFPGERISRIHGQARRFGDVTASQ